MNKRINTGWIVTVAVLFMVMAGQEALATPVVINGAIQDPAKGQNYTDYESGLPQIETGTDAVFTISTNGNFGVDLNWDIDGYGLDDIHIGANQSMSWDIDYNTMSSLLDDGSLTIKMYFNDVIDDENNWTYGSWTEENDNNSHVVTWELSYNTAAPVPEPATIMLMGFGLAGIGLMGAKKRKRS